MRPRRAEPGKVIQMDDIVACGDCSRQPRPASWGEDHDREAARSDHATCGEQPRSTYPENTLQNDPGTPGGGTHAEGYQDRRAEHQRQAGEAVRGPALYRPGTRRSAILRS